jgi:hypothetical protein
MRKRTLALLVVLWACTDPVGNDLCACSRVGPLVEMRGQLVSANGTPQPGKRIRAVTASLPCTSFLDGGTIGAVTDSVGAVRLFVTGPPNDSVCVRFLVSDDVNGAPEQALRDTVRVRTALPPWDVVTVPLVLPP